MAKPEGVAPKILYKDQEGRIVPASTKSSLPTATNGGVVLYKDHWGNTVSGDSPGAVPEPVASVATSKVVYKDREGKLMPRGTANATAAATNG